MLVFGRFKKEGYITHNPLVVSSNLTRPTICEGLAGKYLLTLISWSTHGLLQADTFQYLTYSLNYKITPHPRDSSKIAATAILDRVWQSNISHPLEVTSSFVPTAIGLIAYAGSA